MLQYTGSDVPTNVNIRSHTQQSILDIDGLMPDEDPSTNGHSPLSAKRSVRRESGAAREEP